MKWILLIIVVLPGVSATGCGRSSRPVSPASQALSAAATGGASTTTTASPKTLSRRDTDKDNPGSSYYDEDDAGVLAYGKQASPSENQQVTALVKRYYAAATKGDAVAGCTLLYSLAAESIVEESGQGDARTSSRAKGCPKVVAKLFKQGHEQLVGEARRAVTGVRVSGDRGYVLLGTGGSTERYQLLHRESGKWKMVALVDEGLP